MFGLLKQKLTGFLDKLTGREEKKAEALREKPPEEKPPAQADVPRQAEKKQGAEAKTPGPAAAQKTAAAGTPPAIETKTRVEIRPQIAEKPKEAQEKPKIAEMKQQAPEQKPWQPEEKPEIAEAKQRPIESKPREAGEKLEVVAEKPEAADVEMPKPQPIKTAGQTPRQPQEKTKMPEPKPATREQKPMLAGETQKAVEKPAAVDAEKPKAQAPETPPITPQPKPKLIDEKPEAAQKKTVEEKKAGFSISNIWPFGKKEAPEAKAPEQAQPLPSAEAEVDFERLRKKAESGGKKMEVKMGLAKSAATFFSPQVQIAESDIRDLADELELAMLEADVAYEVSLEISARLKKELVGMKVPKNSLHQSVRASVANVIAGVLRSGREFDMVEKAKSLPKPAKILFIGPNGAGKTTTMAKLAKKFADNGMTCVFAAADTFRAAAIEQLEVHAGRLNVPIVKSKYGADPAAVAFDTVQYAKAHSIDVVMIDSSGRQDTNANLLDELKKIVRIIKPDLKIYIGESIGGNATVDQIKGFADSVGLDGVVLTKLDCDAKGGTALSVAHVTGVPILYFGIGQNYGDLQDFSADELAKSLVDPPAAS